MAYVQFGEDNLSCCYSSATEEPSGEDWYLVPEGSEGKTFYKLVDGNVVALSLEEVQEHHANLIANAQRRDVKNIVSTILGKTDWLVQRHTEQVALNTTTSLTESEYSDLVLYRAQIRELSNNTNLSFPLDYPEFPLENRYPLRLVDTFDSVVVPTDLVTDTIEPPAEIGG